MDVDLVRTRLAQAAEAISGLTCIPYIPDTIAGDTLFLGEVDTDPDKAFQRGMDELIITCRVLVSRSIASLGQKRLGGYMSGSGDTSVKAALEAARGAPGVAALGGACDDFHVRLQRGYRMYELGGVTYVGAEWTVRVIGSGE